MQRTLLFSLLLIGSLTTTAQRIRFAPELGVNFHNLTFKTEIAGDDERDSYDTKTGVRAGAIVDIEIDRGFSIQPGLFYTQKGANDVFDIRGLDYRINYLELPFNLLAKVGTRRTGKFFFGGGPYAAVAVGGEIDRPVLGDRDLDIGDDDDEDIGRIDYGINLTTGFETPVGVYFRGNANLGAANIFPQDLADDDFRLRNWGLSISVGYLVD